MRGIDTQDAPLERCNFLWPRYNVRFRGGSGQSLPLPGEERLGQGRLAELPPSKGLQVRIRRSKTDQEGQGQEVAILRGVKLCPIEAVQR